MWFYNPPLCLYLLIKIVRGGNIPGNNKTSVRCASATEYTIQPDSNTRSIDFWNTQNLNNQNKVGVPARRVQFNLPFESEHPADIPAPESRTHSTASQFSSPDLTPELEEYCDKILSEFSDWPGNEIGVKYTEETQFESAYPTDSPLPSLNPKLARSTSLPSKFKNKSSASLGTPHSTFSSHSSLESVPSTADPLLIDNHLPHSLDEERRAIRQLVEYFKSEYKRERMLARMREAGTGDHSATLNSNRMLRDAELPFSISSLTVKHRIIINAIRYKLGLLPSIPINDINEPNITQPEQRCYSNDSVAHQPLAEPHPSTSTASSTCANPLSSTDQILTYKPEILPPGVFLTSGYTEPTQPHAHCTDMSYQTIPTTSQPLELPYLQSPPFIPTNTEDTPQITAPTQLNHPNFTPLAENTTSAPQNTQITLELQDSTESTYNEILRLVEHTPLLTLLNLNSTHILQTLQESATATRSTWIHSIKAHYSIINSPDYIIKNRRRNTNPEETDNSEQTDLKIPKEFKELTEVSQCTPEISNNVHIASILIDVANRALIYGTEAAWWHILLLTVKKHSPAVLYVFDAIACKAAFRASHGTFSANACTSLSFDVRTHLQKKCPASCWWSLLADLCKNSSENGVDDIIEDIRSYIQYMTPPQFAHAVLNGMVVSASLSTRTNIVCCWAYNQILCETNVNECLQLIMQPNGIYNIMALSTGSIITRLSVASLLALTPEIRALIVSKALTTSSIFKTATATSRILLLAPLECYPRLIERAPPAKVARTAARDPALHEFITRSDLHAAAISYFTKILLKEILEQHASKKRTRDNDIRLCLSFLYKLLRKTSQNTRTQTGEHSQLTENTRVPVTEELTGSLKSSADAGTNVAVSTARPSSTPHTSPLLLTNEQYEQLKPINDIITEYALAFGSYSKDLIAIAQAMTAYEKLITATTTATDRNESTSPRNHPPQKRTAQPTASKASPTPKKACNTSQPPHTHH